MTFIPEVAAIQVNRRKRRLPRIPRPRTADGASSALAITMGLATPAWFGLSEAWNSHYEPVTPWVWNIPGQIAMTYLVAQILLLLVSAGRSDRIGMNDFAVSGLALLSVFGTAVVVVVKAFEGKYHLGGFQTNLLYFLLEATLTEFLFTGWMRFLVNRRYFASAPAQQQQPDDSPHHTA